MKINLWITALILPAITQLCPMTLSAQGLSNPQNEIKQLWLQFHKELGLQDNYSADMQIQTMGMTIPGKLYRHDAKTRIDAMLPVVNLKMVLLELIEKGQPVAYSVFPDTRQFCTEAADKNTNRNQAKLDYQLEELGHENYAGINCKKSRLTLNLPDGRQQVMEILFDATQKNMPVKITANIKVSGETKKPPMDLNAMVAMAANNADKKPMDIAALIAAANTPAKTATNNTSTIVFKNYNFNVPPPTLFVIPSNYTKAASIQAVIMGNLLGGAQL